MRKPWIILAIVFGCAGSEKSDAESAAEQLCSNVAKCHELDLFVSRSECEKKTGEQFDALEPGCYECLAEITCAGWSAIEAGDKAQCDLCGECCKR